MATTLPSIERAFEGISEGLRTPPDPTIAVGDNFLVQAVNSTIRIADKQGVVFTEATFTDFFESVSPPENIFDPQLLYDAEAKRFVFVTLAMDFFTQGSSSYLIAVSSTSDPRDEWYLYLLKATPSDNVMADYPTVAIGNKGIYVGTVNYSDTSISSKLAVFNKQALYHHDLAAVIYHHNFIDALGDEGNILRPVTMPGTDSLFVLSTTWYGGSILNLWKIEDPFDSLTKREHYDLEIAGYDRAESIMQPKGCADLDAGDARLARCTVLGNTLYTCFSELTATRSCVRVLGVDLAQRSITDDISVDLVKADLLNPNIAVVGSNMFLMAHSIDDEGNLGMSVALDPLVGGDIEFVRLKENDICYDMSGGAGDRNRWGDYTGFSIDPDGKRLWTTGEYPTGETSSSTWIAAVQMLEAKAVHASFSGSNLTAAVTSQGINIRYSLEQASQVRIELFDMLGRSITASEVQEFQAAGPQNIFLNQPLSSGAYLVRLSITTGGRIRTLSARVAVAR